MSIRLNVALPSELADEAASVDGANDWAVVQPSGASKLFKVRPLAAVPNLPASKITSGTFDLARIPDIVGFVGQDIETGSASLSGTFAGQLSITTTGISSSTVIFILAQFTGYATRSSGTDQFGVELQLRRGVSTVLVNNLYACYAAGGLTSASAGIGGTAFIPYTETISSNQTYYLDAKMVTGSTSASRVCARMYVLKIR